jgi:hypothetical protein
MDFVASMCMEGTSPEKFLATGINVEFYGTAMAHTDKETVKESRHPPWRLSIAMNGNYGLC